MSFFSILHLHGILNSIKSEPKQVSKNSITTPTHLRADLKSPIALKIVEGMIFGKVPIDMLLLPPR